MTRKIKNGLVVPNDRELEMYRRHLEGETLESIGRSFGCTRELVRQRLVKCFGATAKNNYQVKNRYLLRDWLKEKGRIERALTRRMLRIHKIFGCHEEIVTYINGQTFLQGRKMYGTPAGEYFNQYRTAITRGIGWEITFPQWWQIWQESGRYSDRGRGKNGFTMSRYGDVGPYSPDNVYITTVSENFKDARKYKPENELALWRARQKQAIYEKWATKNLAVAYA